MKLFLFLGIFVVGLVQPAFAEILLCPNTPPVKWTSGLFGGKAQIKMSGKWADFCAGGEGEVKVGDGDEKFVQSCTYGDQSVEMRSVQTYYDGTQSLYFTRDYELIDFEVATRSHGICTVRTEKVTSCRPSIQIDECNRLE